MGRFIFVYAHCRPRLRTILTVPQQTPSAGVILSVLALAVLSTAFVYILYFRLIQNIGSTKALTVTYLIPLFAMLWGAIVLNEAITLLEKFRYFH